VLACDDAWHIVVAGGVPTGCGAVTASEREGANALLVEVTGGSAGHPVAVRGLILAGREGCGYICAPPRSFFQRFASMVATCLLISRARPMKSNRTAPRAPAPMTG